MYILLVVILVVSSSHRCFGCRQNLTGYAGLVNSNGYPENYEKNLNFSWLITAEDDFKVQLRFTDFHLGGDCKGTYLALYDGDTVNSPLISKFCGLDIPPSVETTGNQLLIQFVTDDSKTERGFEASWLNIRSFVQAEKEIVKRQTSSGLCGGVLTEKEGVLTTPNYPSQYPPSIVCEWIIKVPGARQITLDFDEFDLESHRECRYDYVEIKDGDKMRSKGKFCGRNKPAQITSSGNSIKVKFSSDTFTQKKGFKARWKADVPMEEIVCGGSLTTESGEVESPGYPKSSSKKSVCNWNIEVPKGKRIKFTFTDIDILDDPNCAEGYVLVHEGKNHDGKPLGKYCGSKLPNSMITEGNTLSIGYLSDGSDNSRGFKAKWTTEAIPLPTTVADEKDDDHGSRIDIPGDTQCGKTFTSSSGYIVRNSGQSNCSYVIKVSPGEKITVTILELNMAPGPICDKEQIEIRNGINAPFLARSCGDVKPDIVTSFSNVVEIRHTVFEKQARSSFKAYWEIYEPNKMKKMVNSVDCGISKIDGTTFIKGVPQGLGTLPWVAGIIGMYGRVHCGGTIITPNWILTAAHCFERLPWEEIWTVRVGEFDLNKKENTEQTIKIGDIFMHPDYNSTNYENDIALLYLKGSIEFNNYVNSICLPTKEYSPEPGEKCSFAGWGARKYLGQPEGPLTHVRPEIVSKQKCNSDKAYQGKVTKNMICAGGNRVDSCQGDGGGALTCTKDNKQIAVGISSWGNGCAIPGKPGVYTKVIEYIDWIEYHIL